MKGTIATVGLIVLFFAASCSADETATTTQSTTSVRVPTIAPATTTTTGATTTAVTVTTLMSTSTVAQSPSTNPQPTTTTTLPTPCDLDQAIGILDATITLARLEPGGPWQTGSESAAFGERTNDADEYGARLAYTCAERLVQHTPNGAQRLALVAWNEKRHAVVLQATDAPLDPYETSIRFQLFLEQPYGEWLQDQTVWAATMSAGESIVIATRDYSPAITAKSWQSEVPRFEDLPFTLESEQFGIDALIAVGARNVSVAEPASLGYPIGTIQFNTPMALNALAAIGPADTFDPMVPLADGESMFRTVDGVEIRVTDGIELGLSLYETGWSCGEHSWRLYAVIGSPEELFEFTEALVRSLHC